MGTVFVVLVGAWTIVWKALLCYGISILAFPIPAVLQEQRIWKTTLTPMSAFGICKCYLFNVVWMVLSLIFSIVLLPLWAFRGFGRSVEVEAHCLMERTAAKSLIRCFIGTVQLVGSHHIPSTTVAGRPAPVYVANHASQIDTAAVYFPIPRFKWIAKSSVFFVPGAGQIMYLSGHVFIDRKTGKNSKSVNNLYEQSNTAIQSGIPMFLFPQGTRRMSTRLPFKDGAFRIALENEATIVPMSVFIPSGSWNSLYPLNKLWGGRGEDIVLTFHPNIQVTKDMDKDKLKKRCFDVIYSVLPMTEGNGEHDASKGKQS